MPSHYESFGMVALEAMAMGKPVIASEVGGLSDLISDGSNGLHVPSRDPASLAEAISRVLGDREFAAELGANARSFATELRWDNISERVLQVYHSFIGSN